MNSPPDLSPEFLADLARIHATLCPPPLAPGFVAELERAYAALATVSGVDFDSLASHFDRWRQWAQQQLCVYRDSLPHDDPLLCPISLFRTMDYGRLETAHTRTLAWMLDQKEHGFEDKLLAALLRHLIAPRQFDKLEVKSVKPEYPIKHSSTDERGRLDVFAEGQWHTGANTSCPWLLMIEAKIDAWEGKGQLAKYDAWATAWVNRHPREKSCASCSHPTRVPPKPAVKIGSGSPISTSFASSAVCTTSCTKRKGSISCAFTWPVCCWTFAAGHAMSRKTTLTGTPSSLT